MLVDRYTKIVLTVIAAALVVQTGKDLVSPARANSITKVDIVKINGQDIDHWNGPTTLARQDHQRPVRSDVWRAAYTLSAENV